MFGPPPEAENKSNVNELNGGGSAPDIAALLGTGNTKQERDAALGQVRGMEATVRMQTAELQKQGVLTNLAIDLGAEQQKSRGLTTVTDLRSYGQNQGAHEATEPVNLQHHRKHGSHREKWNGIVQPAAESKVANLNETRTFNHVSTKALTHEVTVNPEVVQPINNFLERLKQVTEGKLTSDRTGLPGQTSRQTADIPAWFKNPYESTRRAQPTDNAQAARVVSDKSAEAARTVSDKSAQSAVTVNDKNAEAARTISDKHAEAARTITDKSAQEDARTTRQVADLIRSKGQEGDSNSKGDNGEGFHALTEEEKKARRKLVSRYQSRDLLASLAQREQKEQQEGRYQQYKRDEELEQLYADADREGLAALHSDVDPLKVLPGQSYYDVALKLLEAADLGITADALRKVIDALKAENPISELRAGKSLKLSESVKSIVNGDKQKWFNYDSQQDSQSSLNEE